MSRSRKAIAAAAVLLMISMPIALLVSAGEETAEVPVTAPNEIVPGVAMAEGEGYAVFFADNMAFAPQWRTGNLVRIESMILKTFEWDGDGILTTADIPIDVNANITSPSTQYTQADLLANPNDILYTWMVSVPQITVTISGPSGAHVFASDFSDGTVDETDTVGREINKAGHLIYGLQWDTTGAEVGVYKVSVSVPAEYGVLVAVRHIVVDEEAEPIGYESLPTDTGESGTGGIAVPNDAYIYLGELIGRGSSGGNGGGDGGGNGPGGGDSGGGGYSGGGGRYHGRR